LLKITAFETSEFVSTDHDYRIPTAKRQTAISEAY